MKINVNGINVHYTVQGEGPWVVMSHSLACDSRMWENEVKALSKRYKVLTLDTRGHGGTDGASKGGISRSVHRARHRSRAPVLFW